MRVFKVKGYRKKVRLPEWAYKRLLKRFDVGNAKREEDCFIIKVPCICACYAKEGAEYCHGCPFSTVAGKYGCMDILTAVGLKPGYARFGVDEVEWDEDENVLARKELQAIHMALLNIPRS